MRHILVVDDDKLNLAMAYDALKKEFMVSLVSSGTEALAFLENKAVDLILLDIEMPQMNGIETLKIIKDNVSTSNIPVIFLTAVDDSQIEAECIALGAQDYIIKPFYQPAMAIRIHKVLELESLRKNLEDMVIAKTKDIECLTIQTITSFANSIDAKDSFTKYHSQHVAKYAQQIALKLGWDEIAVRNLYYAALLHDIGKIGVPDFILSKPGRLTDEEYEAIKKHPAIGGDILSEVTVIPYLGVGARSHHERWDGTGYPDGKKGEEIPLVGRIIGIADAVDAMMSTRSYREGRSVNYAINELKRCAGKQFDPGLVDIMADILEKGGDILNEEGPASQDNSLFTTVLNEYSKVTQMDGLTGLWNKNYLEAKINEYLYDTSKKGAMIMLETDNYRRITSLCGHVQGENLLISIAQTIQKDIGVYDLAGRISNDEFVIYLNNIKYKEEVEYRVIRMMKAVKNTVANLKLPVKVDLFMGVVLAPRFGKNFNTLYHNADKSLYFVKQSGKGDYFFYSDDDVLALHQRLEDKIFDIWQLKVILSERVIGHGAYKVDVNEFEKIFKLLQRTSKRTKEMVSMISFTFEAQKEDELDIMDLEEASKVLMDGMENVLRAGDVMTRFSSSQHLVLLTGASANDSEKVGKRVADYYETMKMHDKVTVLFDVTKIN